MDHNGVCQDSSEMPELLLTFKTGIALVDLAPISFVHNPEYFHLSADFQVDETRSFPRRIYCNNRQRALEGSRLSSYGREVTS